MYTDGQLQSDTIKTLRQRRHTLENLKNPSHITKQQMMQNSRILQLAFLDKIIEDCDRDQQRHKIKNIVKQTKQGMEEIQ